MNFRNSIQLVAVTTLALGLAACGGGKSTQQTAMTGATNAPQTEAQREAAALPLGQMAPVNINCGAVKPVWVNLHTKAYHEPGDPYYGRTKNGQYMCPSQAAAQGYHPAGMRHKGMNGGSMSGSTNYNGSSNAGAAAGGAAAGGAMQQPYPTSTHHRRRHGASSGATTDPNGN
jgi:hypothetical protein